MLKDCHLFILLLASSCAIIIISTQEFHNTIVTLSCRILRLEEFVEYVCKMHCNRILVSALYVDISFLLTSYISKK